MSSAAGKYLDEAKERGMDDSQSYLYATIMGSIEGGTEKVISSSMLSKIKQIATGAPINAKMLNSFGVNVSENFVQETIMEPLSEATATLTGGKDKANWDNILNRSLTAGVDGIISAILLSGASIGIGSALNVTNKINNNQSVTNEEIRKAIIDTQENGQIDIEDIIKKSISEVKDSVRGLAKQTKLRNIEQLPVNNEKNRVIKKNTAKIDEPVINILASNEMPADNKVEKVPTANLAPSELMRAINQRTNNNIELDVEKLPRAKAKLEGNKITLDYEKGGLEEIIHETTHYSENNSKGYEVLSNHVLTELEKSGELKNIKDELRQLYKEQYAKENRTFTEQDLESEVVAKYTERFINDEIFVNKMANTDKTLTQRIYNWIKDKINYYKKIVKMEPEQKLEYDNLRKAEKLWKKTLKGVNEQNENITAKIINKTKENMEDNSNIKLESISKIKSLITGGGFRTQEEINELKESIIQNGIKQPVELIKNEKGKIILKDGNHRILIAEELGLKEVPVTYLSPGIENIEDIEKYNGMLYNEKDKKVFEGEYVNGRINRTSKEVNSNIKGSEDTKRSNNSNSDGNENRRATNEDDKIYRGQQTNNYGTSSVTTRIENNKWRKIKSRGSDKESFSVQKKVNNTAPTIKNNKAPRYSFEKLENSFYGKIKEKQLEIIKKYNPVYDDYHAWIRNIEDIKTFEESLQDSHFQGYDKFAPDYTFEMAQEAIKTGKITVYSSYPIKQGIFVSPSYMETESLLELGKYMKRRLN